MSEATGNLVARAEPRNHDPIYAAIAAHRTTWVAYCYAEDCDRDATWDTFGEAHAVLMCTQPTTTAGILALFDYIAKFEMPFVFFGEDYQDNEYTIDFVEHMRDALSTLHR